MKEKEEIKKEIYIIFAMTDRGQRLYKIPIFSNLLIEK